MKILMASPYSWAHPGGVNNHISGLATEMMKRGHEVSIIAPDGGNVPPGARFASAGRSLPVPANGSIAHLALYPGTRRRVAGVVSGGGFDVVHVHEPFVPLVSACAVKAAGASATVVGTFHASSERGSLAYWVARRAMRGVQRRLDRRIAVSGPARALASRYLAGEFEVVPNGVDVERFSPGGERPAAMPPAGAPTVLFVGRNERRKGLEVLLGAFPKVAHAVPGCRLVVIGEGYGPDAARLPGGPAREDVVLLGFVCNDELSSYYAAADVFCSPALGGESFGIVLIEAMASGTPVVASDIPGYRDVLAQTGGGLLFRTGDEGDLAAALVRMLLDETLRMEHARAGLESSVNFSWSVLADRIEQIYCERSA